MTTPICPYCGKSEGMRASQEWFAKPDDGTTPEVMLTEWQCTEGCFRSFWLPTPEVKS